LRGVFDLILESVGGDTLGRLVTMVDPQGTLVMFGNSSNQGTTFNVRDIYLDASIRLQGFELFFGGGPFGPDLRYLARLVGEGFIQTEIAIDWSAGLPAATMRPRPAFGRADSAGTAFGQSRRQR